MSSPAFTDADPLRDEALLAGGEIDVWAFSLNPPEAEVARLRRLLTEDEIGRAERFHFEKHRRRFIVGRGRLRLLLGRYLDLDPAGGVRFVYGDKGKPHLAPGCGDGGWHFNLSHSEEMALYGITREGELGVDIEWVRPMEDGEQIAERFFSAGECEVFRRVPRELRDEAFFNCWTRKEAYVKAVGDGLSIPLDRFDLTLAPGEPARMLRLDDSTERAARWSLYHLLPAPGYIGAVAIEARDRRLRCRRWA